MAYRTGIAHPAQQIVLQEFIQTINERMARLERLDNELSHMFINALLSCS